MSNVVAINRSNVLSFSSFGDQGDDARNFKPRSVLYGERFREMDFRESYYTCTQHDAKIYDFDGRIISGPRAMQPLMSAEKSPVYIPLKMRRPAAPVRMGKVIVESYTNLIFGENRFPSLRSEGDERTQDFAQTIVRIGRLPMQMIRARNLGGSMGTVGMSWCFHNGIPRFEVHNAKNLHVHSWVDRALLLPKHVSEVYMFHKVKWDGKGFNKSHYWFRRDWTPNGDFVFKDVPFEKDKDPVWEIDEEKSNRHGDGVVHFEWIQNIPTDEIDGLPDYDGLYDQFDQLDILNSVVTRGAILNLDPTLKLKMDADMVKRLGVRKGSDNALVVGKDGDAEYMELGGSSITTGTALLDSLRRSILETAQCIVPDPNEVAAQGISSVAIKAMFSPMTSKADVLREQYAAPIKRMVENMVFVARARMSQVMEQPMLDANGQPMVDETGQPMVEQVQQVLVLPPRVETQQQVDPMTGATTEVQVRIPREPGDGEEIELGWPPYFPPTYDDQAKIVTAMQTATGGKGFISAQTATELAAGAFGVDPAEERKRIEGEGQQDQAAQAAMFPPGAGGEVSDSTQLPPGADSDRGRAAPVAPQEPSPPFVPEG